MTLSREITAEGKSTCRINGMPATAAILRELCGGLININGQHDSVGLLNPARHEGILDAYAQNGAVYQEYYAVYRELIKVKKELDAIITDEGEKQRKIDLLSYQVQEIEDASLTAGEEETLAARRKVLANASTIRERISQSYALLSGGDDAPGAVDLLGEASNAIDGAAQLDSGLSAAAGQLLDLYYTAKDLSADLIGRLEGYETNDAELDEIEQRMDLIYKLKRKYGDTVEDIIAFGQQAREELDRIQFSQERTEHLQAEKHRLYVLAREKAEVLTQTRLKAFEELNRRISGTLDFLNMPGVRMTLRHTRGPLASHGQDSVEFYISTNPGEDPKPLAKIASGGELSRITLAIKNAMADKDAVPTVIYDEIDSGVSGKAASRIGEVLKQSAKDHQILCITHTAQIAALADCHLLIQKNITNERTYTEIHPLDTEGRVDALAHIISGDHVTELSRANAREMLGLAEHETGD
ncbi:MAG: DNA repair protein RecN [Faecalibacterium prausnitzii]